MPVLDTNFLIALQAGDEGADRLLRTMQREMLLVPSIVLVEYLTPFGRDAARVYDEVDKSFVIAETDRDWALAAADLRLRLTRKRRPFRLADLWIAAWAELAATYVVTKDQKDFQAMGIDTVTW